MLKRNDKLNDSFRRRYWFHGRIDAKEEACESLIGRQFLELFISILDGSEKQIELRWDSS